METFISHRISPGRLARLLALLGASACFVTALPAQAADPISGLGSFSVFDKGDLAQLSGEAKAVRGVPMSTPRFLAVETAWVERGTPEKQLAALQRFNPARYSELNVFLHSNGSNFSRLNQAPKNSAVQELVRATTNKSNELQISREEAARLPSDSADGLTGPVANFWEGVLSKRAAAGTSGQPAYDFTGQAIRPSDEINALLRQQPKVQKQFSGLISGKGEPYWELLEVDNKGVLTLGASYNRKTSGGGYQVADVLYYASGGYYAAVTLHQMWPVQVDGQPATLFWRGDFISSAEIGDLRGIERLGSESALMKDVSKAVRLFRRDSGGAR